VKRKKTMVFVAMFVLVAVSATLASIHAVSIHNEEVQLRNVIAAKQKDNESEYDNMWKKIAQAATVTDAQKQALIEIFQAHAESRGGLSGNAVMRWLEESVPNVDTTTFNNLQNIIVASRDRFTIRQKELLDLKQKHDTLLDSFPSGMLLTMLGRGKIDVTVITSSRAQRAFEGGTDDDVSLPAGGE